MLIIYAKADINNHYKHINPEDQGAVIALFNPEQPQYENVFSSEEFERRLIVSASILDHLIIDLRVIDHGDLDDVFLALAELRKLNSKAVVVLLTTHSQKESHKIFLARVFAEGIYNIVTVGGHGNYAAELEAATEDDFEKVLRVLESPMQYADAVSYKMDLADILISPKKRAASPSKGPKERIIEREKIVEKVVEKVVEVVKTETITEVKGIRTKHIAVLSLGYNQGTTLIAALLAAGTEHGIVAELPSVQDSGLRFLAGIRKVRENEPENGEILIKDGVAIYIKPYGINALSYDGFAKTADVIGREYGAVVWDCDVQHREVMSYLPKLDGVVLVVDEYTLFSDAKIRQNVLALMDKFTVNSDAPKVSLFVNRAYSKDSKPYEKLQDRLQGAKIIKIPLLAGDVLNEIYYEGKFRAVPEVDAGYFIPDGTGRKKAETVEKESLLIPGMKVKKFGVF